MILAAIFIAVSRHLRRGGDRGNQKNCDRSRSHGVTPVRVVTPMLLLLFSWREPPPLFDVMPLSSFGETTEWGSVAEHAVRAPMSRVARIRRISCFLLALRSAKFCLAYT